MIGEKNKDLLDDSFLCASLAYIEVGYIAALADTPMRNNVDYQNAVAYQLFHAIELFYKHMIKKAGGTVEQIHDLMKLEHQYNSYYTGAAYFLEHPFRFSSSEYDLLNSGEKQFAEIHIKIFKPQYMSQHLRYPPDSRTGGYSFSFDKSFFKIIKDRIIEISELIG